MRGTFHVLSATLRLVTSRKNTVRSWRVRREVEKMVKDTLLYGLFLGSFSGGYVVVEEGIALGFGRERTRGWRAMVAGGVAGGSVVLAPGEGHVSLGLWMALKGLGFLVRCGNVPLERGGGGATEGEEGEEGEDKSRLRRAWVRTLLAPTRFEQGDVVLMCVAWSVLAYVYVVEPGALPAGMVKFLDKQIGVPGRVKDQLQVVLRGEASAMRRGASGARERPSRIPCEVVHPNQTCNEHAFGFLPQAFARAIPVYLPVRVELG